MQCWEYIQILPEVYLVPRILVSSRQVIAIGGSSSGAYMRATSSVSQITNETYSTNFAIDVGFVVSSLVPMILVLIFTENHLRAAWRVALGLGVIPPMTLFLIRLKLKEPEEFRRNKMNKYPYWLVIKFYWCKYILC